MSATFEVSRECAAAKLSVLSAHLADSIARLLTLPYIYLDFVKMISTIKKKCHAVCFTAYETLFNFYFLTTESKKF